MIDAEGVRPYCIRVDSFSATTVLRALTLTGVESSGIPPCGEAALRVSGHLDMENCTIIGNVGHIAPVVTGPAQIRNCVFKDNAGTGWCEGGIDPDFASGAIHCFGNVTADGCIFESNVGWIVGAVSSDAEVTIRNCRILDNEGIAVVRAFYEVTVEQNVIGGNMGRLLYGGDLIATFRGNTIAYNQGGIGSGILNILPGSVLEANVFAFNNVGLGVPNGGQGMTITCNDSWGNGTDYFGFDPLPGLNLSADPMFCGGSKGNFFVDAESPLLPENNSCHVLIGVLGQGCGTVSVESKSWGQIKGLYR